jgi:hypothetical protein
MLESDSVSHLKTGLFRLRYSAKLVIMDILILAKIVLGEQNEQMA